MYAFVEPEFNLIEFKKMSPLPFEDSVVTIGNFDGVHLGHQSVIQYLVGKAVEKQKPALVVTFFPNPSLYFKQQQNHFYLSGPSEKETLLDQLGVEKVITFRFNQDFANLSPTEFLLGLKEKLGLRNLFVGEDFALGKDRQGTIPRIKSIGQELSFSVQIIPKITISNNEVSSTAIRELLDKGDVTQAANLLGRYYSLSGMVTHGSDRGSRIGLPTANIHYWVHKKLPAVGVYATLVDLNGKTWQGVTNVGYRPTFENQTNISIETHILNFDDNIYGEQLELKFLQKLRDEQKFPDLDTFLAQIEIDKASARRIFQNVKA